MEIGVWRIESAILTAIERVRGGRGGGGRGGREGVGWLHSSRDGNAGKNILRARDHQYAPDTASPFFFGERKRNEVAETDPVRNFPLPGMGNPILPPPLQTGKLSNSVLDAGFGVREESNYVLHFRGTG